ncbi:MAG: endopeptidase La [Bdellovibrionaceae bacterium]|nr:endopeptidase La [Pseudobdellovibrionaceae bacterium]
MSKNEKLSLPLLPLRDLVIFPYMMIPVFIGREKSINALEKTISDKTDIVLASQKEAKINDPSPDQIYEIGTLASIVQHLRLPDGTVKTILEGKQRILIKKYLDQNHCLMVEAEPLSEPNVKGMESEALLRTVYTSVENYVRLNKHIPSEAMAKISTIDDCGELADVIASQLNLRFEDKQKILEIIDPVPRLKEVLKLITREIQILKVERKIRTRVKEQMEKTQKEYYLNEQLQAIQKELGDKDDFHTEIKNLEEKGKKKKWNQPVADRFKKEIQKLKMMSPMSAETTVVRNYVEWLLDLPWRDFANEKNSIKTAQEILDADHWGLKKVKERIIEYLAVRRLSQSSRSPVICFVGPPGVGKTSLAQSIAKCLNRPFARISLGGVQDEAELRGHRRTYVGSMPGKIIQALKKVKKGNPIILLDEVDKMGIGSFRGDPSSALLEVLDPEQNHTFQDHYIELDYDLSSVLFLCTANSTHNLKGPLLDRMELIPIEGYIQEEKMNIAKRHLIPRQMDRHGLKDYSIDLSDSILKEIIAYYTREAGVRQLERTLANVFRKFAKQIVIKTDIDKKAKKISKKLILKESKKLAEMLGPRKFRFTELETKNMVGLTNGLAWTETGGDTLAVETLVFPGTGKYILTGQLGDVMKESCSAGLSFVRSLSPLFHLDNKYFKAHDFHIHVPEGAIPKDGPSAGVAIITSLVSAILRIPVKNTVAMTGEITLRGRVLPIGGLKEKTLAAHRAHIKTVIFPKDNEKDLKDIPKQVLQDIKMVPVEQVDQVLMTALEISSADKIFKNLDKTWGKRLDISKKTKSSIHAS